MASYVFTLTGASTVLSQDYEPINLDTKLNYEIALLNLNTYHAIRNITSKNNSFGVKLPDGNEHLEHTLQIPTGTYEIEDIEAAMAVAITDRMHLAHNKIMDLRGFYLKSNASTLKVELTSPIPITFQVPNSLGSTLGFNTAIAEGEEAAYIHGAMVASPFPPNIFSVNVIRVDCNLATGSFMNGTATHTLHEFFPTVAPGFKISLAPSNLIYMPLIRTTAISNITIKLLDQKGNIIDNSGEELSISAHIRARG